MSIPDEPDDLTLSPAEIEEVLADLDSGEEGMLLEDFHRQMCQKHGLEQSDEAEVVREVQEALADMEAGDVGIPFEEVLLKVCAKYGLKNPYSDDVS